jgi:ribose-phosphate pyrophosphokinase
MKTIHLNTATGIRFILFPDNQPHVQLVNIQAGEEVQLICSITDSLKLLQLLEASNALTHAGAVKKILVIPYLMAARYDRLMQPGDSFDLEVVAGLINSCGFEKVILFDVHSEVAAQLIPNAVSADNRPLVMQYKQPDAVLICPDAGASKKVSNYAKWNLSIMDTVYCNKKRDLATGRLTLEVTAPEKCRGRNCVVIDDICDGGATFLAIAEQVQPAHLTLIVTHGIFSKGFTALEQRFDEIIVSNSYASNYDSPKVKLVTINYETLQATL